jgi:DNA-binding transcriptional ArsR family regulator
MVAPRLQLLDLAIREPGITTRQLAARIGVDETTASYHLRRLRRAGLVVSEAQGRSVHWFAASAGYCPVLRAAIPVMRRLDPRAVAHALDATPCTRVELAARAGVPVGAARWSLELLARSGIAERAKGGRVALARGAEVCRVKAAAGARCGLWGECAMSQRFTTAAAAAPSPPATGGAPGRSSGRRPAPSSE